MKARLHHIKAESSNIKSFFFEPPHKIKYVAGQFIEMTLPHDKPDDRGQKRWFTLSSSPTEPLLSITTKLASKPSSFKRQLFELKLGDKAEISDPMGDFVLPLDQSIPLVFVAGGVGITPFHSMVSWLVDNEQSRTIHLIYATKQPEDHIFNQTFAQHFISKTVLTGDRASKLDAATISHLAGDTENKLVFISGPEPMVESLFKQFRDLNVAKEQLVTDYFPGYSHV